jgi:lysophospholipase L1-like esterase
MKQTYLFSLSVAALTVCCPATRTWAQTPPVTPAAPAAAAPAKTYQQQVEERLRTDWAYLSKYQAENARIGPPARGENRVVFMGDSITEGWGQPPRFFPGKPYFNRGISGQTTPQMLVRFRPDVIALKPRIVVILGGINDIAGNTGPMTLSMTEDNIASMADLARVNGIRVVLASVLPASDFPWRRGLEPAGKVVALNAWIKEYAARNGFTYLDYYSAMVDDKQGLRADLTYDGVHPNAAGYALMAPLAEKAIQQAASRSDKR